MTTLSKTLTILLVVLAVGAGLVVWKAKFGGGLHGGLAEGGAITKLTKEDMQALLKDANPLALQQLSQNPELVQKQVDSIKEFLAVANEARKEGLADKPAIKTFLEFIRTQIIGANYDKEKNKDKDALPPFSLIKEEEINAFYQNQSHEKDFNELVAAIKEQGNEDGQQSPDPTEEQLKQLREQYAKSSIYAEEAEKEGDKLGEEFWRKTKLQVGLQQAAFLNQLYADQVLKDKVKVSDEEVQQYIASHPEFDLSAKKAKAEELLKKAKAGEDFAKLADENSEDPGTKGKGGLYKDVQMKQMQPVFEQAALALQPGQVADQLVETPYGYHIIKLERKGATKDKDGKEQETYDVRHILISTMFNDPKNPFSQPMSVKDKATNELKEEKTQKLLDDIKAKNPIEVEAFEVPKPSDEDVKKMQEQMMQRQMPQGLGGEDEDEAPTAPKGKTPSKPETKPEPKKK